MSDEPTAPGLPVAHTVGDVLDGRYELESVIGRGGMATVWKARDRVLDRDVAAKVFHDASMMSADTNSVVRATAEVRLLAGLSHPNVVAVYDASGSTADHFDHLIMELVHGRSLSGRLDEGPLTAGETAQLGAELAAGLDYVHDRGIVHRDLKPANVLLEAGQRGYRAKLADFGVARLMQAAPVTVAGTTVGTANYLSPEQATGAEAEPPSDIYSLGLVLLECLTGRMAYQGHGVAVAAARLHRAPEIPVDLDPRWQSLLHQMTAFDPGERPDAAGVAARLADLAGAATGDTRAIAASTAVVGAVPLRYGTAILPVEPTRRRRRVPLFAVLGSAGTVLALVIVLLAINGSGGQPDTPAAPRSTVAPASGSSSAQTRNSHAATTSRTPSTVASRATPSTAAKKTRTHIRSKNRNRTVQTPAGPAAPAGPKKNDKGPAKPGGGPGKPGGAGKP